MTKAVTQYQEALKKYLSFRKQHRKPVKLDIVGSQSSLTKVPGPPEEPDAQDTEQEIGVESPEGGAVSDIINAVPKSYRNKAGQILDVILQNSNIIRWNSNNEMLYNKETIKGSNMMDLLYDVIKQQGKSLEPVGWKEFLRGLVRVYVLEYLIGNPQRRAMVQEYKAKRASGQGWESEFSSPSPVTYSKKDPNVNPDVQWFLGVW